MRVARHRQGPLALPDLDDRLQPELLGQREATVDRVDRPGRHPGGDQQLEPLPRAAGRQRARRGSVRSSTRLAVRSALRSEPRVVGHLGDAQHPAQLAELAVVGRGDDQVAVGGRQRLVREDARVRVAHPVGHHAARDVRGAVVDQPGQRRRQQADLDVLALAGGVAVAQGGQDADDRVLAGHDVEDRDAGPEGLAVGLAGEAHQARDRLHHQVVAGHVRAAARRRSR